MILKSVSDVAEWLAREAHKAEDEAQAVRVMLQRGTEPESGERLPPIVRRRLRFKARRQAERGRVLSTAVEILMKEAA